MLSVDENETPTHHYQVHFSEGILSVRLKPGAPESGFTLYSMDGKLIDNANLLQPDDNHDVILSCKSSGMYIYAIRSESGIVTGKPIVL